ncbi:MAG: cytochrome-c oxidase, cbb3-type subunit I, partial [Pseudomonadota bacterium]
STIGIIFYMVSMWFAGIMEGLMWREYDAQGFLVYSFADTVAAKHPSYLIRAFGGALYVAGAVIMAYNVWRTIRGDIRTAEPLQAEQSVSPRAVPAE